MFPIVYFYKILQLLGIKVWKNCDDLLEKKIYFILINLFIYLIYKKNMNIICLDLKFKINIFTETLYNCYYRKLFFCLRKMNININKLGNKL